MDIANNQYRIASLPNSMSDIKHIIIDLDILSDWQLDIELFSSKSLADSSPGKQWKSRYHIISLW